MVWLRPRGDAGLGGGGGGVPAGGMVVVGAPTDGVAVAVSADGMAGGNVSGTRERRFRCGAFSMAGRHTEERTMGTMEGEEEKAWWGKRTRCRVRSKRREGSTPTIYMVGVRQEPRRTPATANQG